MPVSTVSVPLSEPQNEYIQKQMEHGGYDSPAAVIQNVLEQARLDAAYAAEIEEALNSEHSDIVVTPSYWAEKRVRLQSRLEQARLHTK